MNNNIIRKRVFHTFLDPKTDLRDVKIMQRMDCQKSRVWWIIGNKVKMTFNESFCLNLKYYI